MNTEKSENESALKRFVRRYFLRLSFRTQLIIIFAFTFLIPCVMVTLNLYNGAGSELSRQTFQSMENSVRQVREKIRDNLLLYSALTFNPYIDSNLRGYLNIKTSEMNPYIDAYFLYINNLFAGYTAGNEYIDGITLYVFNDYFPSDGLYIKHIGELGMDPVLYGQLWAQCGSEFMGDVRLNGAGQYIYSVARMLNYKSGNEPYALLVINVLCKELEAIVNSAAFSENILIVTDTGQIASAKDTAFIGRPVRDIFPAFDEISGASGSLDLDFDQEKSLILYETLVNGWICVAAVPERQFLGGISTALTRSLVIFIVFIALSGFVIYLVSCFLSKRMGYLAACAESMARGDLDISIPDMGQDEIGKFGWAFSSMAEQIRILLEEVRQKELKRRQAELTELQTRIKPHFIYNALASISTLSLNRGDNQTYEMINMLARFFRISLSKGENVITIREEIEMCNHYLSIEKIRFENITGVFDVDENLYEYTTIKMCVQPFIENAINHGLVNQELPFVISVRVYEDRRDVFFEITDNGIGMDIDSYERRGCEKDRRAGIGIQNVRERIRLLYGDPYGVEITSRPLEGTTVLVRVPKLPRQETAGLFYR